MADVRSYPEISNKNLIFSFLKKLEWFPLKNCIMDIILEKLEKLDVSLGAVSFFPLVIKNNELHRVGLWYGSLPVL